MTKKKTPKKPKILLKDMSDFNRLVADGFDTLELLRPKLPKYSDNAISNALNKGKLQGQKLPPTKELKATSAKSKPIFSSSDLDSDVEFREEERNGNLIISPEVEFLMRLGIITVFETSVNIVVVISKKNPGFTIKFEVWTDRIRFILERKRIDVDPTPLKEHNELVRGHYANLYEQTLVFEIGSKIGLDSTRKKVNGDDFHVVFEVEFFKVVSDYIM
ncbi:hypothetical protein HK103_003700 [Boothiomyces macroporosus]|uniref:Uncharacterized protein n=1 Tax=Boothiomyces macroporosus TaxID=261099 RepID=A0AAD5UCF1_9FUNG|nr:hypothetical protein HK103_003700 [Boothiomyces macroporosus]